MQFEIINPFTRTAEPVQCEDFYGALEIAGLKRNEVDHGMIHQRMGIAVYEFGLFVPPEKQSYFALGGRLYAGSAVLYGVDEAGETIDLKTLAIPVWLSTREEVEKAIAEGLCRRPEMAVNGDVIWSWPQPRIGAKP